MKSKRKFPWLMLVILGALAAGGGFLGYQNWQTTGNKTTDPERGPTTDPLLPTTPVSRPSPPPADGYVGSAACNKCHEDICRTFARHPMGKSAALTPGAADLEDLSAPKAEFSAKDGTRYKVEKLDDKILHHEIKTDSQGRVLYDQAVAISLAIGSGTRGKTYAANHDGILLQSPISWYASKGGYFELSPGYEKSASNARFSRRLQEGCLACHVGRMEFDPEMPDKLIPPYFHELSIGCERCHGPGEKHVQVQQAGKTLSPDATIVNPARLPMRERESVCYQCHLHGVYRGVRFGRHERDFRPGMALEEIVCVLVNDESPAVGPSKAVSQVEQMWASTCFLQSAGKMGCISCHNPHEWPTPDKRALYYRSRCNDCHAEKGCSLSTEKRDQQQDSCIACHMPKATSKDIVHASQTDHRVLRSPAAMAEEPALPAAAGPGVKFFDQAESRLPIWEARRARGMWLAFGGGGSPGDATEEIESLLVPLAKIAPDDAPLHRSLGAFYLRQMNYAEARKWFEKAVTIQSKHEMTLVGLALACYSLGDLPAAKRHIARAVEINPYVARNFSLQAEILAALGEEKAALAAAEKATELDPSDVQIRDRILKDSQR